MHTAQSGVQSQRVFGQHGAAREVGVAPSRQEPAAREHARLRHVQRRGLVRRRWRRQHMLAYPLAHRGGECGGVRGGVRGGVGELHYCSLSAS